MLNHQAAAGGRPGQGHDETGDHAVGLLGVLVRGEVLTRGIHQHRVELRLQPAPVRETQFATQLFEHRSQRRPPATVVDPHPTLGNLPRVTYLLVQQRPLPQPVLRRPGDADQPLRLLRRHRQPQRADTTHLHVQFVRTHRRPCTERTARLQASQQRRNPGSRRDRSTIHSHDRRPYDDRHDPSAPLVVGAPTGPDDHVLSAPAIAGTQATSQRALIPLARSIDALPTSVTTFCPIT